MSTGAEELRQKVIQHIGYHWWMYRSTDHLIDKVPGGVDTMTGMVIRNALICSHVVHARALAHFFFKAGQTRNGDWTAEDLGMVRPALPDALDDLCAHVNKYVVHITQGVSAEYDYPNHREVHRVLSLRVEVLKTALGDAIAPTWIGNINPATGWPESWPPHLGR